MASAGSAGASRSNLIPAPLGSSFLISTWLPLAGALLVAAPGVAVEQPRLTRPHVSGVPFMTGMNRVAAEKAVLDVMAQ